MVNNLTYAILNEYSYFIVSVLLISAFALLYFGLTGGLRLFFNYSLKKGWTETVMNRTLFNGQIKFEIINSIYSIIIFGLYGTLIVFCYRNEIVSIAFESNYHIFLDLIILAVWNEIHFYAGHKLMHTKWFIGIHRTHHKSVVVTPFSTYSFHPIESLIFGSVMILPMLVIELEVNALIIFPVYHLFFNALGHSNVKLKRNLLGIKEMEVSTHHNDHHTTFNSNFGFVGTFMDYLFRTKLRRKKTNPSSTDQS